MGHFSDCLEDSLPFAFLCLPSRRKHFYYLLGLKLKSFIQGDSGGICITLGNDSMSDSKQKTSYEHGSDFERLRSYGHFLIPVRALM